MFLSVSFGPVSSRRNFTFGGNIQWKLTEVDCHYLDNSQTLDPPLSQLNSLHHILFAEAI